MSADSEQLNELSQKLWEQGLAGFCATTLSMSHPELLHSVKRLGKWIHSGVAPGARPLGIHLEGPYIHPGACGAHPPGSIRALSFEELDGLWEASHHHLKILTIAPELLSPTQLRKLVQWAQSRKIVLSAGHSKATEEQAVRAFDAGFRNVTHAWNALHFHHRAPGILGAALGRPNLFVEVILDQVHIAPSIVRWTQALHPHGTCFVSDCVPAAQTRKGTEHAFGNLRIRFAEGACRLKDGGLAGGGLLLPDAYSRWLCDESRSQKIAAATLLAQTLPSVTTHPLLSLGISPSTFADRQILWEAGKSGRVELKPIRI